jgi:hypothetical protein
MIPPGMMPLPTLVPTAAIISLAATFPWCLGSLRGLWGLRGPGGLCRCLRLLMFFCHIIQTDKSGQDPEISWHAPEIFP